MRGNQSIYIFQHSLGITVQKVVHQSPNPLNFTHCRPCFAIYWVKYSIWGSISDGSEYYLTCVCIIHADTHSYESLSYKNSCFCSIITHRGGVYALEVHLSGANWGTNRFSYWACAMLSFQMDFQRKRWPCDTCGKQLSSKRKLDTHKDHQHGGVPLPQLQPSTCSQSLLTLQFQYHIPPHKPRPPTQ